MAPERNCGTHFLSDGSREELWNPLSFRWFQRGIVEPTFFQMAPERNCGTHFLSDGSREELWNPLSFRWFQRGTVDPTFFQMVPLVWRGLQKL
jgi:general stress protein 26